MEYAVWNTCHDGTIEVISGNVPGDVEIRVEISYLCAKLPTSATYVVLRLLKCTRFEFQPYEGEAVTDLREVEANSVEILGAGIEDEIVSICCVNGSLKLAYERIEISLAEGAPISQEELQDAAKRYWSEWSEKNRKK